MWNYTYKYVDIKIHTVVIRNDLELLALLEGSYWTQTIRYPKRKRKNPVNEDAYTYFQKTEIWT